MRLKLLRLLLLQAHTWLREVYKGNNWGTGGVFSSVVHQGQRRE